MNRRILELSWETFRSIVPTKTDLVLIPVGTLEAHGAMALGTDTLIPSALAEDLATRLDALIAPAIPYGVTNSLLPYPGSTRVSPDVFRHYLFEAAAGLVDAGFRRVVLLNGHGGQTEEVSEVVGKLHDEKRAYAVSVEWWGLIASASREIYGDRTSGHAGLEETAMMLAIAPHTVDLGRANTIRRLPRRSGMRSRPFPATIILDREERDGDAALDLDPERARGFYSRTVDAVEAALREVFEGWADLR